MAGEIEQLIQDVRELSEFMRRFTGTVIDAEEALAKAIGREVKDIERNTAAVDDNTAAVKRATQAKREEWKEARETANKGKYRQREIEDEIKTRARARTSTRDLIESFQGQITTSGILKDQFEKLIDSKTRYGAGVIVASEALQGLAKATAQMASALYKGERGASVTAKAMTEFAKPLTELGGILSAIFTALSFAAPALRGLRLLGLGLGAVTAAVSATTKYQELAAEQTDKLFKSFNELSRGGVNLTGGFEQVLTMAQTLGLTVAELEEFNKLLTSNTQSLQLFGGTAARGADRFANAAGTLVKEFGRELELMGVTATEQREMAMAYMSIQARTGQLMNKSVGQLATESAKYIKELDMLAEMTGTTRKQQQEAQEAALAETRFRAAMIDAEQRGDQEELNRLKIFQRAAAVARSAGDIRGFTGLLQEGAGRGALATPEATAAAQTYRLQELLARNPNPTDVEIQQHLAESVGLQQRQLSGINALTDNIDVIQTGIVGPDVLRRQALAIAEAAKTAGFGEGPQAVEEFLKTEQGQRAKATVAQQTMVDASRTQQNAAMLMDGVVARFNDSTKTMEKASKAFAEAVALMPGAKIAGGAYATGAPATGGTAAGGAPAGRGLFSRTTPMAPPGAGAGGGVAARNVPRGADLFSFGGGISGNQENFDQLDPAFRDRLVAMATEYYQRTGKKLPFGSGFRSKEANAQVGGVGSSLHLQGRAVDLTSAAVEELKSMGLLDLYGLKQSSKDAWHLSESGFRTGGIAAGPASGYEALLHGIEAVVPLPDGKTIPVSIKNIGSMLGDFAQNFRFNNNMIPEIRNVLAEEMGTIAGASGSVDAVVDRMGEQFRQVMSEFANVQNQSGGIAPLLQELVTLQRGLNNTSERMLQVAQN